tara:strand:- start:977 stop:1189 length:213 start_codon:yes stop_codon:yes gene_type:complete
MTWQDIMKKKKGTPFPKKIYKNGKTYDYVSQKKGRGTYRVNKRFRLNYPNRDKSKDIVKVWKEDALRMAR